MVLAFLITMAVTSIALSRIAKAICAERFARITINDTAEMINSNAPNVGESLGQLWAEWSNSQAGETIQRINTTRKIMNYTILGCLFAGCWYLGITGEVPLVACILGTLVGIYWSVDAYLITTRQIAQFQQGRDFVAGGGVGRTIESLREAGLRDIEIIGTLNNGDSVISVDSEDVTNPEDLSSD